jgi:hypothetical protein
MLEIEQYSDIDELADLEVWKPCLDGIARAS